MVLLNNQKSKNQLLIINNAHQPLLVIKITLQQELKLQKLAQMLQTHFSRAIKIIHLIDLLLLH